MLPQQQLLPSSPPFPRRPHVLLLPFFVPHVLLLYLTYLRPMYGLSLNTLPFPCAPEVLEDCNISSLIPYAEFSESFPIIEYCVSEERGFIPVSRQICEGQGVGTWTVRPGNYVKRIHARIVLLIVIIHTYMHRMGSTSSASNSGTGK